MPRSVTTGIFDRVSNSFSHPVFGTLVDPTDAEALFDDQDIGLNPANLAGPLNVIAATTLGKAGTTVGTLGFFNATSGSITLSPPTGALGSAVLTLPDATDTLVGSASPTFTGTVNAANITASGALVGGAIQSNSVINGAGDLTITKAAGVLSELITASASNIQVIYTGAGGTQYFFKDTSAGADLKYFQLNASGGTFVFNSLTDVGAIKTAFLTLNSSTSTIAVTAPLTSTSSILSTSATLGVGYATGAGGAVTQLTSRTTTVILNKICGAITLFAAAPAVGTWVSFTVTNSSVAATDVPKISFKSSNGANTYIGHVTLVAAGSFQISFTTIVGTTSDSPVINFAVIKAVAS